MNFNQTVPTWVPCLNCRAPLTPHTTLPEEAFEGKPVLCGKCSHPIDWWNTTLDALTMGFMPTFEFALLGGQVTIFTIELKKDAVFQLDLKTHGIPADAKILWINYTPQGQAEPNVEGHLFPVELHRNAPSGAKDAFVRQLYPVPYGNLPPQTMTLAVMALWSPPTGGDAIWDALIEAAHAFSEKRYESTIVPANIAVEYTASRLLTDFFQKHAAEKNVRSCLTDGATYGHQLNVIIPGLAALAKAPTPDKDLLGHLNALKTLRNDLSHRGKPKEPITMKVAAKCLCAAIFGTRYLQLLRKYLIQ